MIPFLFTMCDFAELDNFKRRYPSLLTEKEVGDLPQKEFVRYVRENLWEKISQEKFKKPFIDLTDHEKSSVDMEALIKIANAFDKTKGEQEIR
jgi:hypothetical protein